MPAKRIVVAMSGGVDSSVCAALLKDEGWQVIGITMQIWERTPDGGGCCGIGSIADAKKVADRLDIPHYTLNFRDIFREKVVDDFCRQYQAGKTPNPCIRCNKYIKFAVFLQKARLVGANFIATGHYARIEFDRGSQRYFLKKGIDARKDQSYLLYMLTQEQLAHTLMPLGRYTKDEVRQIARERGLPVADKPESQEICFIPDNDYRAFLQKRIPESVRPGHIVDTRGKIVGWHQGIIFYTIGQREGLGIADRQPLYVTAIKQETNTIVVGRREEAYCSELLAEEVNLISMDKLLSPLQVEAKVRYLHPPAAATVIPAGRCRVRLKFAQPQFAITPGQAVVFYQEDVVVGGGTINK